MPKDSPGQIAKLQLNNMGYSGQAMVNPSLVWGPPANSAFKMKIKFDFFSSYFF